MPKKNQKDIFSKNLNRYIAKSGKTQKAIADAIGVSPQSFNSWCQAVAIPRMDKLQLLADYFGIGKSDLLEEPSSIKPSKGAVRLDVYSRVSAEGLEASADDIIDWEEVPETMAHDGDYFCIQLHGDSMEPTLGDKDILVAREQDDAETGDIVIVTVDNNDAFCRRLRKYDDSLALEPMNPAYPPMYFSNKEAKDRNVVILGKGVELRKKL